ncbi:hypothetical protein AB1N83_003389 [Pleurotus pulmonarius]
MLPCYIAATDSYYQLARGHRTFVPVSMVLSLSARYVESTCTLVSQLLRTPSASALESLHSRSFSTAQRLPPRLHRS